ncbi:hypothetical protein GSI_13009 [Ganoderma sinense ZZ0214-1]|uniref:Uncharacterized protein n=1 Tax=Ganoderma sinense ZZ0214-1 TaxID=1077348 RepID=A0A2G8RUD1_9APHY|nr:hypothetical protein GSI_13009 [Ganoderma sinense ZZ0214-1]
MAKGKKAAGSAENSPLPRTPQALPKIQWTANQSAITWSLISEMEKTENRKVLFGKKSDEILCQPIGGRAEKNSSAEHKISVCKRIAEAIVPALYSKDATVAGERVRSKIVSLTASYRDYAVPIKSTGGGVQDSQPSSDAEKPSSFSWIAEIPADGPGDMTSPRAKNIWQDIELKWEFFPRMHRLLCERPNVVPPAVTTGVGPQGVSTVFYQAGPLMASSASTQDPPLSDAHIDPQLRDLDVNVATRPQSPPGAEKTAEVSAPVESSQVPAATTSGKEKLSLAMQKASTFIKPLSNKKRTFEEQLVEMSEKNMALANKRLAQERQEKRQKLSLKKREMLLQEHRLGVITRDEYRRMVYGQGEGSSFTVDTAMRSSSPLPSDGEQGLGVGGSDDIVGGGWER